MVRFGIVSKIIGQLLFLEAAMMLVCLAMAVCYREDDVMAFLISMALTVCGGMVFKFYGRNAGNELNRREAYLVVALIWVVFCAFGMLPLLISGYVPSVTDAYFETMSGFTTTGATIIDDVECLPHTILFWRSLTHWIGGLGIVFFTIAILPSVVGGSIKVFAAESTGPIQTKMHPRLSTDAKWIWMVYLAITAACVLSFRVAGMDLFDSVCYSMSIAGTGGFATHNDSLAHFGSPAIEYIGTLFQFLAGMNFTLIYVVLFKGQIKKLFINSEFKLYCWVIAVSTAIIMYFLVARGGFVVDMEWRDGHLVRAEIESRVGGVLRVRSYVPLKGRGLKPAEGECPNELFAPATIAEPLVSEELASPQRPDVRKVYEYDVRTKAGKRYVIEAL